MNDQDIWDHIDRAKSVVSGTPRHAVAHALISIATSLAEINDRQRHQAELKEAEL